MRPWPWLGNYAASSTPTTRRRPNTSRASLIRGSLVGVPGIEHPAHFLFVATELSRQLHVGHSSLLHRKREGRLGGHRRRNGNEPFAPRRLGRLWNLPPAGNSAGDGLRDIPESDHQYPRFLSSLKSRWIHECPHGCLLTGCRSGSGQAARASCDRRVCRFRHQVAHRGCLGPILEKSVAALAAMGYKSYFDVAGFAQIVDAPRKLVASYQFRCRTKMS